MSNVRKVLADALGLPQNSSDDVLAHGLAEVLAPKLPLADHGSAMPFTEMVASVMQAESISYGDAASRVSKERPDLYLKHCAEVTLN